MLPAPAPNTPPIMFGTMSSRTVQQHAPPPEVENGANCVEVGDCKAWRLGTADGGDVAPMTSGDAAGGGIAGDAAGASDAAGAGGGTGGRALGSSIWAMMRMPLCWDSSPHTPGAGVTAAIKRRQPTVVTRIAAKCPVG